MRKQIDDGGPAFPDDSQHNHTGGMTIRDYFAAAALQGSLAAPHTIAIMAAFRNDGKNPATEVAGMSYEIADAMLAARKEQP
jgi:hypothetical protein